MHVIVAGQYYIIGNFLDKSRSNSKRHYFKVDGKTSYFYHESIAYSFAQFTENKNKFFNKNYQYFEITNIAEHIEMLSLSSLWFYIYYSLYITSFIDV